jgi:acyl-CoA reductase-like NAD-dependent aldehyde dehydrogenase
LLRNAYAKGHLVSINPTTGEELARYPVFDAGQIQSCIAQAHERFQSYRRIPFAQRSAWLKRVAGILEERKAEFGRLISLEMGKTLASAVAEVEKSAWVCRYYAEEAEGFLAERSILLRNAYANASDASRSGIRYQPLGGDFGGDALELSLLAGVSLCRPSPDGGQYPSAQTCFQRAPIGFDPRADLSGRGDFPPGGLSKPC